MTTPEVAERSLEPTQPAVSVTDLEIQIATTRTPVVSDVSFDIAAGEILGVVGESGSGKTTVGLALLGHARRGLRIAGGSVMLGGSDILTLGDEQLRRLRGGSVSYVPQDPASSLNPALRVGLQLREVLEAHARDRDGGQIDERVAEMMREVALPDDRGFLKRYPHELSGGQQQRIGLAMAFANRPSLIVLDEPTTGLDVTTQAHVLETVRQLAKLHDVAALYVSHDLAVVATLAERVAVMYAGRVVEIGGAEELFTSAGHPYTRRLVGAIPRLTGGRSLVGIPGHAVSPGRRPPGCSFAPRCTLRIDRCETAMPPLLPVGPGHAVRCIRAELVLSEARSRVGDPIEMPAADEAEQPALRLTDVVASYGRNEVLHSVSLSLASHECLALVGESGSGKTTVARAVAGLHRNWTGTIALGGVELPPAARQRGAAADPVHLPEPVRLAEPPADDRPDHRPAAAGLPHRERPGGRPADRGDARAGVADRGVRAPVPRSALRRGAATGGDRPGPGLRPHCADLRRGDLGAGRQRPGRDRGAARRPPA